MSHNLSLEVPFISNPKVMRIFDSSSWDSNLMSSEIKLSIIPPGFIYPIEYTVTRRFDKLFNVSNLGIQSVTDYSELGNLPDGIYTIRLTDLSSGDWVEYNHLRITEALNTMQCILCELDINACDPPVKIKEKLNQINFINLFI